MKDLAGWKLAPIEPTFEMEVAGRDAWLAHEKASAEQGYTHTMREVCATIYSAMLAEAPQPKE